jgi:imidazolonepropionase-like amidohydrolase
MIHRFDTRRRAARVGLAALAAALLGATALEAQVPAPRQNRPIALTGGTIHTVSGATYEGGTLVFDNGRIVAVGRNVAIPADAEHVDIRGKHVYPGLIDGYSHIGLFEIGGIGVTIDLDELGRINPNVRAEVAVNPESRHIGVARSSGVLVAVSSPEGGLVSGQAAAMMLDGWTWEQMTLKGGVGMVVQWPSTFAPAAFGPAAATARPQDPDARYQRELAELRESFAAARAYRTARSAPLPRGARPHDTDPRWEAMIPVLDGRMPVIIDANELRQLQDAIAWADEEGVRIVIRGGRDAGYLAEHLAHRQIPVLLTSVLTSPVRPWEPYDAAYSLPARLHAAGVRFAISGAPTAAYAYRLPWEAGASIAHGLPADEALRAVTINAARLLGIDDRVGSLEPGKDATFIVTTGSPLEYSTRVEQAYIEGRRIDMVDAQRRLFQKYQERNRQVTGTTR